MKIVLANKFFFKKGGADVSFFETMRLLQENGHSVIPFSMQNPQNISSCFRTYFVSNVDFAKTKGLASLRSAARILYSLEAKRNLGVLLDKEKPDIIHLNNIFHQISPSVLHAIRKRRLPVVMTLRDYKIVCASYTLSADAAVCEACSHKRYYRCFLAKCVKGSYPKSLLSTVEMYLHHCLLNIYRLVDVFIAPSEFLMHKVKEMGFRGEIVHLPNFVAPAFCNAEYYLDGKSIIYFGRLSPEKGLVTLIDAIKHLPSVVLKIVGDGPIRHDLERKVKNERVHNVDFLGYQTGVALKRSVAGALFSVVPSEWYENNPRAVIESFALGKPVIGARIGGIPELVKDRITGLTFNPGDASDLRDKILQLYYDRDGIQEMGRNGRELILKSNNQKIHYTKLMAIYDYAKSKHIG